MVAASAGRRGRPWRRVRAAVLAQSTVCHLCGHPESDAVDHEPARWYLLKLGLNPEDPTYLRPAHHKPCPTCGVACNQVKGGSLVPRKRATSREWLR